MTPLATARLAFAGCMLSLGLSQAMLAARRFVPPGAVDVANVLPQAFGAWRRVPTAYAAVDPSDSGVESAGRLYDHVDYQSYRRADGAEVLLTLAYRRVQEQESKIHRPELCYFAQGFAIGHPRVTSIGTGSGAIPAVTFVAQGVERSETVLYWVRIGDRISTSAWMTRLHLMELGLAHVVPDGMLVRASIVSPERPGDEQVRRNEDTLAAFLADLNAAAPDPQRWILSGGPAALRAATMR